MIRLVGLVNQNANDLLDAAAASHVGRAGRAFHWDYWSYFIVGLPGAIQAVYFRLAYQGRGVFIDNHLLAPMSEAYAVKSLLAEMPFTADVIDLVRVSLPSSFEHDLLLARLQKSATDRTSVMRTAQDMTALL